VTALSIRPADLRPVMCLPPHWPAAAKVCLRQDRPRRTFVQHTYCLLSHRQTAAREDVCVGIWLKIVLKPSISHGKVIRRYGGLQAARRPAALDVGSTAGPARACLNLTLAAFRWTTPRSQRSAPPRSRSPRSRRLINDLGASGARVDHPGLVARPAAGDNGVMRDGNLAKSAPCLTSGPAKRTLREDHICPSRRRGCRKGRRPTLSCPH
jgi:hypothetical protein